MIPLDEYSRRFATAPARLLDDAHHAPAEYHDGLTVAKTFALASPTRANNIALIRELLAVPLIPIDAIKAATTKPEQPKAPEHPCPCCGNRMRIIETFLPGQQPKHCPTPLPPKIRIDTS